MNEHFEDKMFHNFNHKGQNVYNIFSHTKTTK